MHITPIWQFLFTCNSTPHICLLSRRFTVAWVGLTSVYYTLIYVEISAWFCERMCRAAPDTKSWWRRRVTVWRRRVTVWRRRVTVWRHRVMVTPLGHGDAAGAAGSWWRHWVMVTPPGRDDATGSWWQWIVVITGCNCWVLNSGSAGFTSHPQLLYTNYVLAHSAWPSLRVDEITTDTIILG